MFVDKQVILCYSPKWGDSMKRISDILFIHDRFVYERGGAVRKEHEGRKRNCPECKGKGEFADSISIKGVLIITVGSTLILGVLTYLKVIPG
ncbi:hypothetical protein A3A05_00960 [Candidatus Nomurabacteria bacterium RIFCSPLOWO2_01_FULL_41_12]|uniref:Uncharacterized protein n=1 Tax=Candidatus Nomurabacteria bacterium RIFCSPLOWO2_01_FULL_41_12 TaxID=1801774 RepID=A0A1F6WX24_9BACT|nr:MAG: hypothetical protein A3A05_00960 [Candidatus Nomurabacteria bacterium RIFCSPLOWO2_01_FULL_41_12]